MNQDVSKFLLGPRDTIKMALATIDANRLGIVLVVDPSGVLLGTVTDGDIRRSLLRKQDFETPLADLYSKKPIVASARATDAELLHVMNSHKIRHVPLVDEKGKPVRIAEITRMGDLDERKPMAVVMAGGKGSRLHPLTKDTPKPMLKVGNIPVLENTINRLVESGITDIYVSVNHEADVIKNYFQGGEKQGASIRYLHEDQALGNAGPLRLLPFTPHEPFLVINGDVLTKTNFTSILNFHRQHQCVLTVGAVEFNFSVPYGVLRLAEHYVLGVDEKPKQTVLCNAGIYVMNPQVIQFIPEKEHFLMTQLLAEILGRGLPVMACPIHEYWLDIGQKEDFERAQKEYVLNFEK